MAGGGGRGRDPAIYNDEFLSIFYEVYRLRVTVLIPTASIVRLPLLNGISLINQASHSRSFHARLVADEETSSER